MIEIWNFNHLRTTKTFRQHGTFLKAMHVKWILIKSWIVLIAILASLIWIFEFFLLFPSCFLLASSSLRSHGIDVCCNRWFRRWSLAFLIWIHSIDFIKSFLKKIKLSFSNIWKVRFYLSSHLTIELHDDWIGLISDFFIWIFIVENCILCWNFLILRTYLLIFFKN